MWQLYKASNRHRAMTPSRSQELSAKADEERRRCRDWLLKFMRGNEPKLLTKPNFVTPQCANSGCRRTLLMLRGYGRLRTRAAKIGMNPFAAISASKADRCLPASIHRP